MTKLAILIGGATDILDVKTGNGVAHWRRESCVAEIPDLGCDVSLGLPKMDLEAAKAAGAQTLIVGVTSHGGTLGPSDAQLVAKAMSLGFGIVSGLHTKMLDVPVIKEQHSKTPVQITELRTGGERIVGSGAKRSGKRILTVGTDCCVGKMFTALSVTSELEKAGATATFKATGQTGIMIAGSGICIDAIVSDFVAGNVELLSPDMDPDHYDVIEGQGSLFHPAYAGPSISLLHGAQPDHLVMCHEWGRQEMDGTNAPVPSLEQAIEMNLLCARVTNPAVKLSGISLNTRNVDSALALDLCKAHEDKFGVPCTDMVRHGAAGMASFILEGS